MTKKVIEAVEHEMNSQILKGNFHIIKIQYVPPGAKILGSIWQMK